MTDLRVLSDEQLAYMMKQLELKIAALRSTATAAGMALLEQYRSRLAAAQLEAQRRQA